MSRNSSIKDLRYMSHDDLYNLIDGMNDDNININTNEEIDEDICPNCESVNLVEDFSQGINICTDCGQVVSMILDKKPEWNNYEDGEEIGRCSMPTNPLLPQSSLGTRMHCWGMIKKLHDWSSMPYRERMLNEVFKEIVSKCQAGNIIKCIEDDAKILFKHISDSKYKVPNGKDRYIIIRGANRKSLIAACVFYACKRNGDARSPMEIANIFEMKYTDITKGCKTFQKIMSKKKMDLQTKTSSPGQFVERYAKRLKLKRDMIEIAKKIAENATKLGIGSDHTSLSIGVGAIMLMIDIKDLDFTKKYIAAKFNVSEVTVTKTHRKLKEYSQLLMCDAAVNKIVADIKQKRDNEESPVEEDEFGDETIYDDEYQYDSNEDSNEGTEEDTEHDRELLLDLIKRIDIIKKVHKKLDKEFNIM